jgi:Radical SAM superfamily
MSGTLGLDAIQINIHAAPCSNRCRHCWTEGGAGHGLVPADQVAFVLERLGDLGERIPYRSFFLYDEPTLHPGFVDLFERAAELGLVGEGFFLPTNGTGLARASDDVWERLPRAGANCLQLTAYGLEATHDAFAGRACAFQDIVETIRRAEDHGFRWYAGVVLHADSAGEGQATMDHLRSLSPGGEAHVGCLTFLWQGRGRDAGRLRTSDRAVLPEGFNRAPIWVEERGALARIAADPELAGRGAGEGLCGALALQVDRDLRVFCGSACDSGGIAAAVPELRESFLLGTLGPDGFPPLIEGLQKSSPPAIALLDGVTFGELAERYGDPENDEIYFLDDLPSHKWAAAYLIDQLGPGSRSR